MELSTTPPVLLVHRQKGLKLQGEGLKRKFFSPVDWAGLLLKCFFPPIRMRGVGSREIRMQSVFKNLLRSGPASSRAKGRERGETAERVAVVQASLLVFESRTWRVFLGSEYHKKSLR